MKVVIIKGNPDFIKSKVAKKYYRDIELFLKANGVKEVAFDPGEDFTCPDETADFYIGHSRGAGRARCMKTGEEWRFLRFGDPDGIMHPVDRKWHEQPVGDPPDEHFLFIEEQKKAIVKLVNKFSHGHSYQLRNLSQESLDILKEMSVGEVWRQFHLAVKRMGEKEVKVNKATYISSATQKKLAKNPSLLESMRHHDGTLDFIFPVSLAFSNDFPVEELVKFPSLRQSMEILDNEKGVFWEGDYWPVGVMGNGDLFLLDISAVDGKVYWRSHEEKELQVRWDSYLEYLVELMSNFLQELYQSKRKVTFKNMVGLEGHASADW